MMKDCGVIMILPISNLNGKYNTGFGAKKGDASNELSQHEEDRVLKNNFTTRTRISLDKLVKGITVYPASGLSGSRNSNFYEFLTMGNFPYIVGSISMMAIFNGVNGAFSHPALKKASQLGNKMALGVLFYGLFKRLSKSFVNYPVKLITGVDTEIPYLKINKRLQEHPNDFNVESHEYHKVGESVDFTYWDMLYGDPKKGEERNFRFDRIARKNGLGKNLNDSDQEVKPIYKEILVKSKAAKSISTYLWAATGVALAFQNPWLKYFNVATLKFWKGRDFVHSLDVFRKSFADSVKDLYYGGELARTKIDKHGGKLLMGAAVLSTVLGVLNTVHLTKKPSKVSAADVIDKNKECVVG